MGILHPPRNNFWWDEVHSNPNNSLRTTERAATFAWQKLLSHKPKPSSPSVQERNRRLQCHEKPQEEEE
ncbi:hypothetical protein Taro_051067 [Colocasia esculenta]|uniref:Uncharacterized protein n=1 Tax=Colocasia esculenta TaxID=4460 RepID=A0A843XFR3_COLES|nr:hypothetical protein [Colocasia esculenta]